MAVFAASVFSGTVTPNVAGSILADATNDRAQFTTIIGTDVANREYGFRFMYQVI